jgi:hypothetical protein
MADPETKQDSSTRVQIIVAVIGLLGVIATAVISNWNTLFPKPATSTSAATSTGSAAGGQPPSPAKRPPKGPGRAVHSQGKLEIRGTWSYDLDEGVQASAGVAPDFFWEQATNVNRYITPESGAAFFVVGIRDFRSVTWTEMENFPYSSEKINASDLPSNQIPKGTVVAYRTKQKRLGKFIVETYGHNLTIRWITYD